MQDRLREWKPSVLAKIERFSCMAVAMLDIDGYRIDKGLTITIDAMAHWSSSVRACAKRYGKENFFISGMNHLSISSTSIAKLEAFTSKDCDHRSRYSDSFGSLIFAP